jgi:hypothetical protein
VVDAPDAAIVKASVVRTEAARAGYRRRRKDKAPIREAEPKPAPRQGRCGQAGQGRSRRRRPPSQRDEAGDRRQGEGRTDQGGVKAATVTATLLPSDLGKLIAAEKKGAKPARTLGRSVNAPTSIRTDPCIGRCSARPNRRARPADSSNRISA